MSHDIINLDFDFHILILLVAINLLSHQVNKLKLLYLLYLLIKKNLILHFTKINKDAKS